MTITVFKVLATPVLIWAVSMAGRRWGAVVSGLLIGLPLTSGPVIFFITLEHGTGFARQTASGILLGAISVSLFCLAYAWLAALRRAWPLALLGGWLATLLTTLALDQVHISGLAALGVATAGILAANWLMPHATGIQESGSSPWWDIPARMIVATAFLLALTASASSFGAYLSGLLATLPIYASILVGFNHHLLGPAQAIRFARGLTLGLFGFIAFFAVIEALLTAAPLWATFGAATIAALATQAALGWLTRDRAGHQTATATR